MKYFLLIIIFILAQNAESQSVYKKYQNSRYGFSILIPKFLKNAEQSLNGDGCTFWDSTNDFKIIVAGGSVYNENPETKIKINELYEKEMQEYESVTYSLLKDDYYVLSGYEGEKIFYIKNYYDGEQKQSLIITYSKSDKHKYDSMVNTIVKSFVKGNGDY